MGHYRTFDGKLYDLKGHCEYTLVEQLNNTIAPKLVINHKNDHANEDASSLTIRVMKTTVMFKQGNLYINQMISPDESFKNNDVSVKKTNSFFYSVEGRRALILLSYIFIL